MQYKNTPVFFSTSLDVIAIAKKLDLAMADMARNGFEVFAVTSVPTTEQSTHLVVSGKKPEDS